MDLQQQQTGIANTEDPQAVTQPSLSAGSTSLQQNGTSNVNQLNVNTLSVTNTCTTICSGSIPPVTAATTSSSGISGGTWLVIGVAIVVVAVVAWMFRQLSTSGK